MDAGASGGAVAVIASASRPIDLVEHAAFGEVRLLGRRPAAEIGDCQKLELREAVGVAGGGVGRRWAEIMLRRERLPLRRVEELKIGLRKGPRAAPLDNLVYDRDGRLGEHAEARHDYFHLALRDLVCRHQHIVLPYDKHIADAAPDEGYIRSARASAKYRIVTVQFGNYIAGFIFILTVMP